MSCESYVDEFSFTLQIEQSFLAQARAAAMTSSKRKPGERSTALYSQARGSQTQVLSNLES